MNDERDNDDESQSRGGPSGDALWDDVRFWVEAILSVFDDLGELARVGVARSLGVTLCNWLWGVEGAIRRLIIAQALKLDLPAPAETGTTDERTAKPAARKRRPCFRIFGFNRQGEDTPAASAGATATPAPACRHIPFPADPLLSIGPPRKRAARPAFVRRANPLDRRGAISRFDPDYGLGQDEDYERALLGLSPRPRPARSSGPKQAPLLAQERRSYLAARADPFDWKRVEEEWKRIIPAPNLAARIFAVAGIMERRDQAALRIARLLARSREHAASILNLPPPQLAWPRPARGVYRSREVEEMVERSHARLLRLDTS